MRLSVCTLVYLAVIQAAAGLKSTPAFATTNQGRNSRSSSATARQLTGSGVELEPYQIVGPVIILIAGIVGTTLIANKNDSPENEIKPIYTSGFVNKPSPAPEPTPELALAPAPATITVEKAIEPAPAPAPKTAPVAVAAPAPAPKADAGEKVAELRKGVANRVDKDVPQKQLLKRSSSDEVKVTTNSEQAETSFTDTESSSTSRRKSGGKRRFLVRVAKKVLMPWRKWKNIE